MTLKENTARELKRKISALLAMADLNHALEEIRRYPAKQLIGPLFSHKELRRQITDENTSSEGKEQQ